MPSGVWSWKHSALVTTGVATPLIAVLLLRPESRGAEDAALLVGLITYVAVLAASGLVHVHWRSSGLPDSAWLSAALLTVALPGIASAALGVASVGDPHAAADQVLMLVVLASVMLAFAVGAERRDLRHDPWVVGLVLGVPLAASFVLAFGVAHLAEPPASVLAAMRHLLSIGVLVVALLVLRLSELVWWARWRLAVVCVLLHVSQVAMLLPSDPAALAAVAVLSGVVGSALLLSTALAMLRGSIAQTRTELDSLHEQLEDIAARARLERERIHQIGTSIAGIASATQVIRQGAAIPSDRRGLLEAMLDSEIARLERLMAEPVRRDPQPFVLDDVVAPLVLGHGTRGHHVHWRPSGLEVLGRSDDLCEVMSILLENAARHGGAQTTRIDTLVVGDHVAIRVSDQGPGVPAQDATRIFEWGERSASSPGDGIGLNLARRLVSRNGGSLELDRTRGQGAAFTITLPVAVGSQRACAPVA